MLPKVWELTAGEGSVLSEVQFLLAMNLVSLAQVILVGKQQ